MCGIDKTRWNVLSPLLDELLDVDEGMRAQRLVQIGNYDQPLADELIELLEQLVMIRRTEFLEGSAIPDALRLQRADAKPLEQSARFARMGHDDLSLR